MIPSALGGTLMCFAWTAVRTPGEMYGWTSVYAVVGGSMQAIFPAGLVSLTPDVRQAGLRMGMAFTLIGFSVLMGPPVAGAIVTATGGRYVGTQVYAGSFLLVGSCMIIGAKVARKVRTGGKWTGKI